jgi:hypothetical protein
MDHGLMVVPAGRTDAANRNLALTELRNEFAGTSNNGQSTVNTFLELLFWQSRVA